MDREIIIIAHDMRSAHNVGSLIRTADGLGVSKLYLTGYTPYPLEPNDTRLPHIANKLARQITKTSLGAETMLNWEHHDDIDSLLLHLADQSYKLCALEQTPKARQLNKFSSPDKIALVLGNELSGIDNKILQLCDIHLEIPMLGKKESFNVVQAAAMAMYQLRFGTIG